MKTIEQFDYNTTLEVLKKIRKTEVDPLLKGKILTRLESETPSSQVVKLSPQIQWAAAILILLLNAVVLFYTFQSTQQNQETITDLDSFARAYSLSSDDSYQLN